MSNVETSTSEPTYPYPPRFWWFKRLALLGLLLVIGVACLRVWWGRVATRELNRAVATLRARGEPVWASEFQPGDVHDDRNAAAALRDAFAAINPNAQPPSATNLTYRHYPPFPPRWHQLADQAVEKNAAALKLARDARQRPKVEWNLRIAQPAFATLLPQLNQARELAHLLGDAAIHDHLAGDEPEAIERIRDMIALARAVDEQPFIVSHLVARGITSLAYYRVALIASDLHIAGAPATMPVRQPAPPAQVRELIADILAHDTSAGVARAYQGERMGVLDTINWTTAKNPMLRPMFRLDQVRVIREIEGPIRAATRPSPTSTQPASVAPGSRATPEKLSSVISSSLIPAWGRIMHMDWRVRTEARLAAAALAARLYHAEHGRWPESIEALVPEYLPAVPEDPWAAGAPIKFTLIPNGLPDGSPRPVVYSVGEDGQDDTARGVVPPAEPQFDFQTNVADQWRDLTRWVPAAAASQPWDDEEND